MDEELSHEERVLGLLRQIQHNTARTASSVGWLLAITVLGIIAGAVLILLTGDDAGVGNSSGFG